MKIEDDREVDSLYISIADADCERTEEIGPGVNVDYDKSGRLIGIEVIGVSEKYSHEDLSTITTKELIGGEIHSG
jgi:uncharacterized protein YuzE